APSSSTFRHGRLTRERAIIGMAAGLAVTALPVLAGVVKGTADVIVAGWLLGIAGYLVAARLAEGRRSLVDRLVHALLVTAVAVCLLALGAILIYTISRGLAALHPSFFTHTMSGIGPRDATGGAKHAILGTLEQVLLASLISVPLGILMAVYLNEYGRGRLPGVMRTMVDVMTGI